MRKYFIPVVCMMVVGLLGTGKATFAQDQNDNKTDDGMGNYDEIIIKKKDDKKDVNAKVTIEVKDGKVTVNGKPIDDYNGDDLTVIKRKVPRYNLAIAGSPFRQRGGVLTFDNNNGVTIFDNGNSAFLGVSTEKPEKNSGAQIQEVTKNSAAEKAGLKKGDVITKVDDIKIESPEDLVKAIGKYKPDDKVTVTYTRDGKESTTTATLGKREGMAFGYNYVMPPGQVAPRIETMPDMRNFNFDWRDGQGNIFAYGGRPRIGIKAQDTEDGKGVKVLDVTDESPADKAGIKEDDIITEFNGKTVNSADELADAARDVKDKTSVKVKLNRDGKAQTVEIKIPRKLKTANL